MRHESDGTQGNGKEKGTAQQTYPVLVIRCSSYARGFPQGGHRRINAVVLQGILAACAGVKCVSNFHGHRCLPSPVLMDATLPEGLPGGGALHKSAVPCRHGCLKETTTHAHHETGYETKKKDGTHCRQVEKREG